MKANIYINYIPSFYQFQITALIEEIARLRNAIIAIQDKHNQQVQRFEECLDNQRKHISRLEARIESQSDLDDATKESR